MREEVDRGGRLCHAAWMIGYTHAIVGIIMMAIFYFPLRYFRVRNAHWIAMAVAVSYYWGREKRDHENRLKRPAAEVWHLGFFPWEYSPKGMADIAWPFGVCLAAALAIQWKENKKQASLNDEARPNEGGGR